MYDINKLVKSSNLKIYPEKTNLGVTMNGVALLIAYSDFETSFNCYSNFKRH